MTPVDEQRRHCAACDKTLTDFSCMTDRQIGQILSQNGGNLCGRFRSSQLDRPLRLDGPRRRRGLGAIAASAGLLLVAPAFGQGVAPEPIEKVETTPGKQKETASGKVIIKGTVTDRSGEVLIGASILIKGTTTGTATDIDGRFSLALIPEESVVLVFSYTGLATIEVTYSLAEIQDLAEKSANLGPVFALEEAAAVMMEAMVCGGIGTYNTPLDNLMVHPVRPIYSNYGGGWGKSGDWKDYWRDLFAKRKARRAERRIARQARKLEQQQAKQALPGTTLAPTPALEQGGEVSQIFSLKASPNPFDQELKVSFSLPEAQAVSLTLLDATGRLVVLEKHRLQAGWQAILLRQYFGSLAAGTYLLRLQSEHNGQETIRLIR